MGNDKRDSSVPDNMVGILSASTVAKALLAVLIVCGTLVLVYLLRNILILFLLGLFIATVIDPGVQLLRRFGIPPSLAILLHYIVFFALAAFLVASLIPVLASQITGLSSLSTSEFNKFLQHPSVSIPLVQPEMNLRITRFILSTLQHESIRGFPDALERLGDYLQTLTADSLTFATQVAGSVLLFLFDLGVVLLFAFFLELERDDALPWVVSFFPQRTRAYLEHKARLIHRKLSQWAKGQLILCLCIAVLVFAMLAILRVPYALTLALLAGFTEFIPYVGPLIAAVPGILIATVNGGFLWGFIVLICYYAVQWSENNLIVPIVMKHAVDISAVAIMFAMMVAVSFPDTLNPIIGILLAIPATAIIGIFLDDLQFSRRGS